jgi:hypothetical protein
MVMLNELVLALQQKLQVVIQVCTVHEHKYILNNSTELGNLLEGHDPQFQKTCQIQ